MFDRLAVFARRFGRLLIRFAVRLKLRVATVRFERSGADDLAVVLNVEVKLRCCQRIAFARLGYL